MHSQSQQDNTAQVATRFANSENVSCAKMSSREIAELTGKRHPDVKRDIQSMASELEEDVSDFARIYLDSMNREQTEYLLDKELTETLLTGYSAKMRRAVVRRWTELEAQILPRVLATLPDFSNPAAAARAWAEQFELQQAAQHALAIAAPKAAFVDHYVQASGSMGFRQVAKLLNASERQFRQMLLDSRVMYYLGGVLSPYQHHQAAGRFEVKTGTSESNGHAFSQARFTPKGVEWVAGMWAQYQLKGRV